MSINEELKCVCPEQVQKEKHILALLMENAEKVAVALNLAMTIEANLCGRHVKLRHPVPVSCMRDDLQNQGKALGELIERLTEISTVLGCFGDFVE